MTPSSPRILSDENVSVKSMTKSDTHHLIEICAT